MSKKTVNKAQVLKSISKMVSDKKAVRSYIKGETDIKAINEKGIKFVKPI